MKYRVRIIDFLTAAKPECVQIGPFFTLKERAKEYAEEQARKSIELIYKADPRKQWKINVDETVPDVIKISVKHNRIEKQAYHYVIEVVK